MLLAQHHAVVALEHLPDIGLVVLAGDRQQDALPAPLQQQLLEVAERRAGKFLADGDAVETVFTDDAAPQRIVAVQHDAFLGGDARGDEDAAEQNARLEQPGIAEGLPVEIPLPRIEGRGEADLALHGVEIDQPDQLERPHQLDEFGHGRAVEAAQPLGVVERQKAGGNARRQRRHADDDGAREAPTQRADRRRQRGDFFARASKGILVALDPGRDFLFHEVFEPPQQDDGVTGFAKGGLGIVAGLEELVEGSDGDFRRQSARQQMRADILHQAVRREAGGDAEAQGGGTRWFGGAALMVAPQAFRRLGGQPAAGLDNAGHVRHRRPLWSATPARPRRWSASSRSRARST